MSLAETRGRAQREAPVDVTIPRTPAWALPGGLALVTSILIGGFALLASAIILVFGPSDATDWGLYLLTLGGLLPVAFGAGRHLARRVEVGGGHAAVSGLAARAAGTLLSILLLARLAYSFGAPSSPLLVLLTTVWGAWLVLLARRISRRSETDGAWLAEDDRRIWTITAALACLLVLAFLSPRLSRPLELTGSLALAGALTAIHVGLGRVSAPRWARRLLDVAAIVLVILIVTDVSAYLEYLRPDARTVVLGNGTRVPPHLLAWAHRHHEDFWLGPLNDMLHGRPLLVDTFSQYGVGVFYFLAALFQIAPLGYGTLGLVAGFLTALQYAVAYGVLRLAGCARTLALLAVGAAVIGLLLGGFGSPADFPATGGLRFGLPWLVVALAVASARWPAHRGLLRAAAIGLVAVTSVWSAETFVYSSAAFAGAAAFEAAADEGRQLRGRAFGRDLLAAAGCCVIVHVVLALGIRSFAGSWPDWSVYLAYLRVYSAGGGLYILTVPPWSPGMPMLLLYLISGLVLVALVVRRSDLLRERRPLLIGLAATSAFGVASFTYFVGQSAPNTLLLVSLPALVAGCLGVSLLGDPRVSIPGTVRLGGAAAVFWILALLAISGWPDATKKWQRTALAQSIPDGGQGGSIRESLPRIWGSPPSDPRALEAEALLDHHLPRGQPALVIVEPELSVETLVRSSRVNLLPLADPEQDNLVPHHTDPKVRRAVDGLQPGTLMLTQPDAFDAPVMPVGVPPTDRKLVRVQKLALDRIRARFSLHEVERTGSGLALVRLYPKRAGSN